MKRPLALALTVGLVASCAPHSIRLPRRDLAISGEVSFPRDLELRLVARNRLTPVPGDPLNRICTSEPVVHVQVYDLDGLLLWEREFPKFSFARVDERGVLVGLEGQATLLAFDREGRARDDVPSKGFGIPGDALTLERSLSKKPQSRPAIDIPAAAFGSAQSSDPLDVPTQETWVERIAADRFATFDGTQSLRVTDTQNRVRWSLGLPEASSVHWKDRQFIVTEPTGEFRLNIDGEFLSSPPRPVNVPYESPLAFERVRSTPGGPLFLTSKGKFLGGFGGKVYELVDNAWRVIPKLSEGDNVLGFLEPPGKAPLAITSYVNEVGGLSTSMFPVTGKATSESPETGLDYARLAVAHGDKSVIWGGHQSLVIDTGSDTRIQKLAATPLAVGIYKSRLFLQAAAREVVPAPTNIPPKSVNCPNADRELSVIAELVGEKLVRQPVELKDPITVMGVEGDHLWVAGHRELAVLDAGNWKTMPSPLEFVNEFWSPRAGVLWAVGIGGVARFDGTSWKRVLGTQGTGISVRGRSEDDLWISTTSGVFHGTRKPGTDERSSTSVNAIRHVQLKAEPLGKPARFTPQPLVPKPAKLAKVEFYPLPKVGTKPFHPHAASWLGEKLLLSNGAAHVLWDPKVPARFERLSRNGNNVLCFSCGALDDLGATWTSSDGSLATPKQPKLADILPDVGPIRAISSSLNGLFVVGEVENAIPLPANDRALRSDQTPVQLAHRARGTWQQYAGLPRAMYLSVSGRDTTDVWLAGALTRTTIDSSSSESRTNLPRGEGIVAHVRGENVEHFRAPLGPVWAIAQDGPNSAWAVGVAGQILRVSDKIEGFTIPDPVTLWDIVAVSPSERWAVGDRSTILHTTSSGWEALESTQIPLDQSLTRVLLDRDKNVWILGYGGLYKVKNSR